MQALSRGSAGCSADGDAEAAWLEQAEIQQIQAAREAAADAADAADEAAAKAAEPPPEWLVEAGEGVGVSTRSLYPSVVASPLTSPAGAASPCAGASSPYAAAAAAAGERTPAWTPGGAGAREAAAREVAAREAAAEVAREEAGRAVGAVQEQQQQQREQLAALQQQQRQVAAWVEEAEGQLGELREAKQQQGSALADAQAQLQSCTAQCASAEQVLGDNDVAGLRHRVAQLHTHVERQLSLMGELRKGVGDAQSEAAGVSAELAERLPQLKAEVDDAALTTSHTALTTPYDPAYNPYDPLQPLVQPVRPLTTPQVDDVASARLPGLQRQLLTLGDSTNAMWEVINGLVQGGEQGGASREDDFGSARRGAAYDYSDEVQFPQPVYAACSDVGRRGRGPCSRAVQKWSRTSSPVDRLRPRRRGSLKSMLPSQVCRTSCGRSLGFFPGMVGFLSKSFRAATGVKDLEGKFEMLLQGRYRCFRELSQTSPEPPPRATHITKACPATMHPPPGRATTPAHDHATSPLHAHAHSTRTLALVSTGQPSGNPP